MFGEEVGCELSRANRATQKSETISELNVSCGVLGSLGFGDGVGDNGGFDLEVQQGGFGSMKGREDGSAVAGGNDVGFEGG